MLNEQERSVRRRYGLVALALVILLALLVMPLPTIAAEAEGSAGTPVVAEETVSPPAETAQSTQPEETVAPPAEEQAPAETQEKTASSTEAQVAAPAEASAPVAPAIPPPEKPEISLSKTGPDEAFPGQLVTYTITVTNTGDVELHDVTMYDNQISFFYNVGTLAPGASVTRYPQYTIPLNKQPNSVFPNNAGATGYSPQGQQAVDNDNWHIRIIEPPPADISLVKDGPDQACVGAEITYTYYVSNTGGHPLTNVSLTDDKFGDIDSWPSLAIGTTVSTTKTVTVEENWASPYVNTATVTADVAEDDFDNFTNGDHTVSDKASHSLVVLHPSITVDKSVSPDTAAVGDTVTYSYLVTNTGDTVLTNVNLVDDKLGPIASWPSIPAGGTETVDKTYVVAQGDVPEVTNVAKVTATTPCQTEVSDEESATLQVTGGVPAGGMSVTKSLDTAGTILVGDSVSFTFVITNTGTTKIVAPIAVIDTYDPAMLSFVSASVAPTSAGGGTISWADASGGLGLDPGKSISVTVTFEALKAGTTTNSVTASGMDEAGTPLSGSSGASATITETPVLPPPVIITTPPTVVTAAAPSGVLPVTGGDFAGLLTAALILIPLGLLGMTAGIIRRRRSLTR